MKTAWIIEFNSPTLYYSSDTNFCGCINHAKKFKSKRAAEMTRDRLMLNSRYRVVEHAWAE